MRGPAHRPPRAQEPPLTCSSHTSSDRLPQCHTKLGIPFLSHLLSLSPSPCHTTPWRSQCLPVSITHGWTSPTFILLPPLPLPSYFLSPSSISLLLPIVTFLSTSFALGSDHLPPSFSSLPRLYAETHKTKMADHFSVFSPPHWIPGDAAQDRDLLPVSHSRGRPW